MASTILKPGDQSVVDANGKITSFGKFGVVSDIQQVYDEWGVIIGFYGKGGSGKTTLACNLADPILDPDGEFCPIGVLDAEAGIKSVSHLIGPRLNDIPMASFAELEDFMRTWQATPKDKFPWKTIVIDNLSEFANMALSEYGYHGLSNKVASQPDYNVMTTRVTDVVRDARDCALDYGVNVILLLWEQTEKTEKGVVIGKKADITPKLGTRIQGMLDYIGYLTIEKDGRTRKLQFSPRDSNNIDLDSKMRRPPSGPISEIPFELYRPNMADLLRTIRKGQHFPAAKYRASNPTSA